MEFKKIQLNGFKSFADKTNFLIENGLTGIVGPNGCGKSNIVESLRWVMGETSAKSMRGSGMEDVIFSGTSNKASKNIAEVSVTVANEKNEGPIQYRELDEVNVRRKIEKDKGSKFYINDKEVRARDAQMFFADLSTGAHSPSMISQGRIGAIVTAKPTDRRAILEEAAGISGLHVRRHEAELRLSAAENNLKRADELRRQQERQLVNLQKQAEEAARYKNMSEDIKKIEAGLYYLKLLEIDKEIRVENEINVEAETEVTDFNKKITDLENLIKSETEKITPLREKNIENLSKIQRLNLELQSLDEENTRIQDEIENIKKTLQTFEEDIGREKGIVIDANSNEKRLKEEKNELIEIDSKYYDTEKQSDNDLNTSKEKLQIEIEKVKELINSQKNQEALSVLDNCKILIEAYAGSYSRNENIKKESVKRNERIKIIDTEIESWKNLLLNSEKMVAQLTERRSKLNDQLNKLDNQPKLQAEKKGQITEGLRISEKEKDENEEIINSTDEKIENLRSQLNEIQEQSIQIRERKASSGATIEGLKKRKSDLVDRINSELNLSEENILENSNLFGIEELPDAVNQEDLLDKKKQERERLGSVNLKADEETNKYETEIKKMESDRVDLVTAIVKLKESINELNQKGRERLIEAFDKVDRKFNEVYTKLFNGGNAKLELVDADDPLEAGLEMLVSPPGKRLQSITLLSGGEQALTALSLIFAVFLTNPSPICVLDEVDAPLDDANVTRFCSLLEELTKITDTKFIIVTHHALTMSKMNRLYGVTMPEKGISQLVAVDLQKAESMVA
ncbi:chromosome segregation SMC family protein [Candidatus Pelagibacter sp. RS39]|uniref:chromosome segregation SMC family protein n=1 Tax=Candidatus Pelagibacter sp. RS39 TaxID=1977864 RepID=UPI000A1507E7|nr:chromosome segregation SMC family protein [Candidatus Pelagibacter sp. RS39]ARJ48279.1 chromosome segregation protein SMC [Candidatus Pelagibacter sp. RS39]